MSGDGYTSPVVGGGGDLVRDRIRSSNYVAGTSGWAIFANGVAEFLNVLIRGELVTGAPGTPRVEIKQNPDQARIQLYGDGPTEAVAAELSNTSFGDVDILSLKTSDDGNGILFFEMVPKTALNGPDFRFRSTAIAAAEMNVGGNILLTTEEEIDPGEARATDAGDASTRTTTSTSYVDASTTATLTVPYPPSGKAFLFWQSLTGNTGATATASVSVEVRDNNASGTVRLAANDNYRVRSVGTEGQFGSAHKLAEGLPRTGTMFVRLMLKSSVGTSTASMAASTLGYMPVL